MFTIFYEENRLDPLLIQLWLDFRAAVHEPRGTKTIQWTRAVVGLTFRSRFMILIKPFSYPRQLLATPYAALLAFMMPALRQLQVKYFNLHKSIICIYLYIPLSRLPTN